MNGSTALFSRRRILLRTTGTLAALVGLLVTSRHLHSADWTRYRGPNGAGVSPLKGIPSTWSPGDYTFNVKLPGEGHAAVVVRGSRLFVTSAIDAGATRFLYCLDAETGEARWKRQMGMNRSRKHAKSSWASSTPCVDDKRVYAAFADKERYTVTAYDFDGELVWRRVLGPYESQHGLGASPIVYRDLLIVPNDQDGPSSIIALNRHTGRTVWSQLRYSKSGRTSYATPLIVSAPKRPDQLICVSGESGITSLNPLTGQQNWTTEAFPLRTVASPVTGQGLIIASCGQGGRYGVLQRAVDLDGKTVWTRERHLPYVVTPILFEGHLYEWNDKGILNCVDLKTGKDVWVQRIGGNYSGSPICIDGKIYGVSEKGDVVVVAASPTFKLLGRVSLGDPSHSTPSVANGRLYFRTFHRLICLEARPDAG